MSIAGLSGPERLVVEAAALGGVPLPPGVVAHLLGVRQGEALSIAERLSAEGWLSDTARGFVVAEGRAAEIAGAVGGSRRSVTFGALADAFEADPSTAGAPEVGRFLLEAGRPAEALPRLAEAALGAAGGEAAEALPGLDAAIRAYDEAGDDPLLEGRLHLARAQAKRLLGQSAEAAADADVATRRLEGAELVDAYGWAASLADDRQRIGEAERLLAMGEYVAATHGEQGKLGSLLTLRARVLGRLGFGDEAEAAAVRGTAILAADGTAAQRALAATNRAWVAFDQGRMQQAEAHFAGVVARRADAGGPSAEADARAWRARALMYAGLPDEALREAGAAEAAAGPGGEMGPLFLAAMARSSGAALHGAGEDALAAADRVLAIVLEHLPQWENSARYLRAQALLTCGDADAAAGEIALAVAACPDGADGDAWRLRCRALALRIGAARGTPWPASEADEVTEACLTARWNLPAAQVLADRALAEKDPELARRGAALALQLGVPMVAARNVHAGRLWDEPVGSVVATRLRALQPHIPDEWAGAWAALPEVAAGLETPEPSGADLDEATEELRESLAAVFEEAGLAGAGHVLSPAQRRAAGMRIRRRRRRPVWQTALGIAAAAIVAGVAVTALVVAMSSPEPDDAGASSPVTVTVTTPAAPTTTTIPPLEARVLPDPEAELTSQWGYGGERILGEDDRGLAGVANVSAVVEPGGYYWQRSTNSRVSATIVARGRNLFVGDQNGDFYVFETGGRLHRTLRPDGNRRITTPAAVELIGATASSEATRSDVVFFGDTEGRLHAADAGEGTEFADWQASTGGPVSTAPLVVGDLVLVGSVDGYVHAFDLASAEGATVWRFPADGSDIPPSQPIDAMALSDGVVYVVREDGSLYGIDPLTGGLATEDGRPLCAYDTLGGTPAGHPVAADGYLFVSAGVFLQRFDATDCREPETIDVIVGGEASTAPAVDIEHEALYQPIGFFLLRYDVPGLILPGTDHTCQYPVTGGRVRIASTPAIAKRADGTSIVYFGDDDGVLHAIDGETCEELWNWQTSGAIESQPALGDRVVFITSTDGTITAIGPAPDGE
ncbi:MAG: PQQ-binding-like beta-propeller repeat protein [Actinobacteria bacterium]|nr:PQQ-binding-like beta-propeller repeat protein [Actinomycetota bacterium]